MREKRLSTFVRVCFLDGRRNRGSVVKLENRASLVPEGAAAEAEPLIVFCLTISQYWIMTLFSYAYFDFFSKILPRGNNMVMFWD